MKYSSIMLLLCRMGRLEESVQNQFVLFACGKAEVRSRLMVDSRQTLQVFSQESLALHYSLIIYVPCTVCAASINPTGLATR